jgi:hypothetical protein
VDAEVLEAEDLDAALALAQQHEDLDLIRLRVKPRTFSTRKESARRVSVSI